MSTDQLAREGRPLAEWLPELVSEDHATRKEAGEVLIYAVLGYVPDADAWLDTPEPDEVPERAAELEKVIAEAVDSPGFPKEAFVKGLCERVLQAAGEWAAIEPEEFERLQGVAAELAGLLESQMAQTGDLDDMETAMGEFLQEHEGALAPYEAVKPHNMAIEWVFNSLGEPLLLARDGLRRMLNATLSPHVVGMAAQALGRIGPPAADFAEWLLDQVARTSDEYDFVFAAALGSVSREDAEMMRKLVDMVPSDDEYVAAGAVVALGEAGPAAATLAPNAPTVLLAATYGGHGLVRSSALRALASVRAGSEDALDRLLEAMESSSMEDRAAAIDGLAQFTDFPERVVPVLTEALESFEEPDPDDTDYEPYERVIDALLEFGPAAAPAVPALVEHLQDDDGDVNLLVVNLLESLGPHAEGALPALKVVADDWGVDEDDEEDPIATAIRAIRGGEAR